MMAAAAHRRSLWPEPEHKRNEFFTFAGRGRSRHLAPIPNCASADLTTNKCRDPHKGREKWKTEPRPGWLVRPMVPPCSSTMARALANPIRVAFAPLRWYQL